MLKIGLTGGIGSGKSYIASIFEKLDIPVYYSDDRAKTLMEESPELAGQIMSLLGPKSYTNGAPDRKYIAGIVFANPDMLGKLNKIVHPAVESDFESFVNLQPSNVNYIIKEAAILFESGSYKNLDAAIYVKAPLDIRLKRVMARDNVTEEQVKARMENQWPAEKVEPLADFVIDNSGKLLILPQILAIDKKLRS